MPDELPETTTVSENGALAQELAEEVAAALAQGTAQEQVVKNLVAQGAEEEEAVQFVAQVAGELEEFKQSPEYRQMQAAKGKKHVFIGSLWLVGGTIVTVLTFANASEGGGYMLFWGAILFGGIEALWGLGTWIKYRG